MDEMIRYIFGSLHDSETSLQVISKLLKKQEAFNRSVAILSMAMSFHLIAQELKIRNINCELKNLQKEIKELKNTEGD